MSANAASTNTTAPKLVLNLKIPFLSISFKPKSEGGNTAVDKEGLSVKPKPKSKKVRAKVLLCACGYCQQELNEKDFLDEHELQCRKNPSNQDPLSQDNFIKALGLINPVNQSQPLVAVPAEVSLDVRHDSVRKWGLKPAMRTYFVPLTSARGQGIVVQLGGKLGTEFRPVFDKHCNPVEKPEEASHQGDLDDVKSGKLKTNGVNNASYSGHVYTKGKGQREQRYKELMIGLRRKDWNKLQGCKAAQLSLKKVNPNETAKLVKDTRSYLEKTWKAALEYPVVSLWDIGSLVEETFNSRKKN